MVGFAANDYAKRRLSSSQIAEHTTSLLAGMYSGLVCSCITTPFDGFKIMKQASSGRRVSYVDIVRAQGITGLYSGLGVTAVRDVPGWCAYFCLYSCFKRRFERLASDGGEPNASQSFWSRFFAGGFAGQISWLVAYPADVVKSNVQSSAGRSTALTTLVRLCKTHGVMCLFRGLSPCMVRAFPVNSVVFVLYEHMLETFESADYV